MLDEVSILQVISNRILELTIMPTEQCNFRCTYCYEDFSIGKMQPKIIAAVKKLILARVSEIDLLKIAWFGGEPLVAKDVIYELSQYIQTLKAEYPALKTVAGVTTNGFQLKSEVLHKLVSLDVNHFQISLDGTEECHDQSRKRMNGDGTFAVIWKNLLAAKISDLQFTIVLRIHVHPNNIPDVYRLLDRIKLEFGGDQRFQLFFKAIENLGGPTAGTFEVMRGQDKESILSDLKRYVADAMTITSESSCGAYVCYAAKANALLIRANGSLAKCTVALNDDRNAVGCLNEDGTLTLTDEKLKLWMRGIKSQNVKELECPLYGMPQLSTRHQHIPIRVVQ